jgi:hypothetical protein
MLDAGNSLEVVAVTQLARKYARSLEPESWPMLGHCSDLNAPASLIVDRRRGEFAP